MAWVLPRADGAAGRRAFMTCRPRSLISALARAALAAAVLGLAAPSAAQVTEPDGTVVPGVSSNPDEVSLQQFFDAEGETINTVAEAAFEPGVFSPLCDFQAALVLSESSAQAGISWYNVPADATSAPPQIYEIVPEGTPVGQIVASADIRTNPAYAGGFVGFVLTRGADRVYYSEYQRNVLCTACAMPDHWKMALIYRSSVVANAYYLGFEDWPGANESSFQGNDGDMNDKVFRITGVSCPGGGDPCDTGLPGICAPGLTECEFAGSLTCKQQVPEAPEVCDGLDNDCDGEVDQGDLCPTDEVCDKGRCVKKCGEVLVTCSQSQICNDAGFCVEADCATVECPGGQRCEGGECREPCAGVVCPEPLVCQAGHCADPCEGVVCDPGRVCDRGVCVMECACAPCTADRECADDGRCVALGCAAQTCAAGTVCDAGACVDACEGAVCPAGQQCIGGTCVEECEGVTCEAGQKCLGGACVESCSDIQCSAGLVCVPGASNLGTCVDACAGVTCPAGEVCTSGGVCAPGLSNPTGGSGGAATSTGGASPGQGGSGTPAGGASAGGMTPIPGGVAPTTSGGTIAIDSGGTSVGGVLVSRPGGESSSGCGCRLGVPSRSGAFAVLGLTGLLLLSRRRRRRG